MKYLKKKLVSIISKKYDIYMQNMYKKITAEDLDKYSLY